MTDAVRLDPPTVPPAVVAALPANVRIREEVAFDVAAREALLDDAFGFARSEKTSARLRDGRQPARGLALVAVDQGELVGTLRCWSIEAGGRPALLLGPLAVARSDRSRGIGARLMREALWRAAMAGHKAVLLVGDASVLRALRLRRRAHRRPRPAGTRRSRALPRLRDRAGRAARRRGHGGGDRRAGGAPTTRRAGVEAGGVEGALPAQL